MRAAYALLLWLHVAAGLKLGALFGAKPKRADDLRGLSSLTVKGVCAHRWASTTDDAHSILKPIAQLFDDLKTNHREALVPELAPPAAGTELQTEGGNFHCYAAGTTRAMRWLYAADAETLNLFRPLASKFLPAMEASVYSGGWEADTSVQLSAASFISIVGAKAGITDDIARWHEDWGPCKDHEAFSVLLPLFDTKRAPDAYRLEYRTWDCIDEVKVYDYELGDAIVVDGRAPHRTAPFSADDLAKVDGERVLVCLNYASTEPSARPAQIQVMQSQTPHFYELAPS
jgi:hypothetical protein